MTVLQKLHRVKQLAREPLALTIAGLDPTGGAGATRDLQVMAAHGVFGVTALTALTVQSTRGVLRVDPVDPGLLGDTLKCLGNAFGVSASGIAGVKIGMLATAALVEVVADWLRQAGISRERVVLDPVIRSSSGMELLESAGVLCLVEELLPVVGWVTPNLDEAGTLLGQAAPDRGAVPEAASRIQALAPGLNVVVTGGHFDPPEDFLRTSATEERWFRGRWIEPQGRHGSHGTGCSFSTALLCRLLLGDDSPKAVAEAKAFVARELSGTNP